MFRDKPQYASTVPFHDIARDRAQQRRLFAEGSEMADGLIDQRRRLLARPSDAHQRDEGRLARGIVLVQRLAGHRFVALDVQYVVGDLEGEARSEGHTSELQSLMSTPYDGL